MNDDKNLNVIIHRGTAQIGGICTEVAAGNTRIFFDFGLPLEGEGDQSILSIDGLTTGTINADAVFLTHYHGDHVGQISDVAESVPIYMEETAKKILEKYQDHMNNRIPSQWAKSANAIKVGMPVKVKDMQITAIASDHSAADSVMFLVEGYNKRILITGDYRMHGFYRDKLEEALTNLGQIDLMITEGTSISRDSEYYHDENWVEEQFRELLHDYKYCFLLTSSSALDRIAAFSRAVPRGKYMLADDYQYAQMQIYDETRDAKLKSHKVNYMSEYNREGAEKRGFGMVVRANDKFMPIVRQYFEKYPDKTCLIYSMWSGYRDKPAIAQMLDICKGQEKTVHVSGHITKEDLENVIAAVKPKKLIVYHTSAEEKDLTSVELPSETELLTPKDGEILTLI